MEKTASLQKENIKLKLKIELLNKEIGVLRLKSEDDSQYQESRNRFKTVFESSRLGNKILNSELKILEVNPALVELLGCDSKEEIIGKSIIQFAPEDKKDDWRHLQDKLWDKATPSFSLETCLLKKDGSIIWCQVTSILFQDMGETLGYTIVEDITEQHNLRLQKEQFISVASHELQTPLTSLKAGLQLMRRLIDNDTEITDKLKKISKSVALNVSKMSLLVGDLLDSTKIEQGQLSLNKALFRVKELLEECCSHIQLAGDYEIIREFDDELEMCADERKIEQVLVNLINNAVKYAPESKEIVVRMERLDEFTKVSVIDKGKGIPEADLSQLFDRYYQVNKNKNSSSGLGLGLFISAEIIRRHDGEIGVDSEIGKGSTFWFTIPN